METVKNIPSRNYKGYIQGLKGFACLMVMLGHYIGLYKYADNLSFSWPLADWFLSSPIKFLLNESFWVVLFWVVSGYLVAMSRVDSLKKLAVKAVSRFLRLGLPILVACLIIYVIGVTVGFHTTASSSLFENEFIQRYYTTGISIWDALKSPIDILLLGNASLNSPYWVLKDMFISSLVIYGLTYLRSRIWNKNISFLIALAVWVGSVVLSNILFASLFGMFVCWVERDAEAFLKNKLFIWALLGFSFLLYMLSAAEISNLFFAALIVLIPQLPLLNGIFSCRAATFVGKISFGIYSFHWPLFCSVGMLLILLLSGAVGLMWACVIAMVVSIAATFAFSIVYYYGVEQWIYRLLKKVEIWFS